MNLRENKEQWEEQIREFKASGLTQREWCEQHNFNISSLRYWNNKLYHEQFEEQQPKWLSVSLEGDIAQTCSVPTGATGATIRIGRFAVEIAPDCNPSHLTIFLKTLAELC
jgi:hypothetical protein